MFILDRIAQLKKTDRIALINREERLSYAGLDERSEAFAAWLLKNPEGARGPVVICGGKETDFLPCVFGALKAGLPYVPVDAVNPPERIREIISDAGSGVTVDFSGLLSGDCDVISPGELSDILQSPPVADVPPGLRVSGEDIACILFTSGSMGRPRGVPVSADNLMSFAGGFSPLLGEGDGGVILNQVSYAFDVSGCSLYGGISRGMTLFTVDREMVANPGVLFHWLARSGLTAWVSTPSFAEICMSADTFRQPLLPLLERFIFCGEVLTHSLCDQLAARFPNAQVINTYGPTEATVLVTEVTVTQEMRDDSRPIPIGHPTKGTQLRVAEEGSLVPLEDGCQGELLILGGNVAPGYYRQPGLTAERFFHDQATGLRGYRTGDICCRENGLFYFLGRADSQIKLGGYRIELEDIEHNLALVKNVSRAAVIPVVEKGKARYLVAFILLEEEDGLSPLTRAISIKKQAAEFLPAYMIPRKIIAIDSFPLGVSGKTDKKSLAALLDKGSAP
ncbi:MAG: AMP-binding protein [Oscillospiraceae bacterium]|jgi:D-alanine--poly(phosphoribitol) ligase subunit 1|nr:AMP-binding protein [Oscillospiraceae bacterium]